MYVLEGTIFTLKRAPLLSMRKRRSIENRRGAAFPDFRFGQDYIGPDIMLFKRHSW